MINKKIFTLSCFVLLFLLQSCGGEEDTTFDASYNNQSGKIVIEGNVTNEHGPYRVKVSRSINVTDNTNNYPAVTNAKVILNDNHGQTEELIYNPTEKVYKTKYFHTASGDVYTLTVTVDGKVYKAESKMPELVELEDLEQVNETFSGGSVISVIAFFEDPPTVGNRYVFKTKVGSKTSMPSTVVSDEGQNGEGISSNINDNFKVVKKDTVFVELQSVDTPVYEYFRVVSNIIAGGISSNPPSNISNGALGYFSAHAVSKRSIIIE